jgi:hypothetical protein
VKIIIDTREQTPFFFAGEHYTDVTTERAGLTTGDYSLAGLVDKVAVERKSLPDLIACLGWERDRFELELARAGGLAAFAVVVEADWETIARGEYRSRLDPHKACQSIAAFISRRRVPFIFAGSRAGAEYMTWSFLRQYLKGELGRLREVERKHKEAA